MNYPTPEDVDKASHYDLAKWSRHLQSPGMSAVGKDDFDQVMEAEGKIMDRIQERFRAFGGWNSTLSKAIGWDKR